MKIIMIAAKASNGCIGHLNTIPWNLPSDLKHFKRSTTGHVILMGSMTWASFGFRALPKRQHVVVSSKDNLHIRDNDQDRVHHASNLEAGLKIGGFIAQSQGSDLYIIGGAQIYEQTMSLVDALIITEIDREYPGDRFFPEIDLNIWKPAVTYIPASPEIPYSIVTYQKTNG
jgi:dihydrofolate reductase